MVPFEDAIAEWRDHLEARGLSLVSIKTYTTHIRSVATETRGMWPGYPDLVRWQTRQKALSKTTRHHKAKSVRCFFQWAMDMEYIGTNPARRLPVPTRAKTLPEFLSDAEMERLIYGKLRLPYRKGERWLATRDLLLTRLLVLTGLRRAEVCRLLVGDVDPQRRTPLRPRRQGRSRPHRPVPRRYSIPDAPSGRAPNEPLFVGRYEGRPLQPDAVNYIFLAQALADLRQASPPAPVASRLCQLPVPPRRPDPADPGAARPRLAGDDADLPAGDGAGPPQCGEPAGRDAAGQLITSRGRSRRARARARADPELRPAAMQLGRPSPSATCRTCSRRVSAGPSTSTATYTDDAAAGRGRNGRRSARDVAVRVRA